MSDINQREGRFIRVPRELYSVFKENPGLQRVFVSFLQAISYKLDDSTITLSDVDQQRGSYPALARIMELEKRIEYLESSLRPAVKQQQLEVKDPRPRANINEIEKRMNELSGQRPKTNISEIEKRIEEIEATYRPRG